MRAWLMIAAIALAAAHFLLPWSTLADARTIDPSLPATLLLDLRLPRTLLVIGYGATLGIAGASFA